MNKMPRIIILLSFLINLAFVVMLFTPITEIMSRPLDVSETPRKAEVIVILAYDAFDTESGFLDLQSRARVEKGLELYTRGFAPKIICVGGNRLSMSGKSYGARMKDLLMLYGVPEGDVLVQDDIPGNWQYYDNLMAMVEKYKDSFDFNNALLVTSFQNTLRIKKAFAKQGITPVLVAMEKYDLAPYNWHTRFNFFHSVSNEYCALFYFWVADRI